MANTAIREMKAEKPGNGGSCWPKAYLQNGLRVPVRPLRPSPSPDPSRLTGARHILCPARAILIEGIYILLTSFPSDYFRVVDQRCRLLAVPCPPIEDVRRSDV